MDSTMNIMFSMLIGLGLSATCGFRVFVPPLVIGLAAYTGNLELSEGFGWLASPQVMIALAIASAFEIFGYYVPIADNFLDLVAIPAAIVAGTILSASMISDVSPLLEWSFAAIAGGGSAGGIAGTMALVRGGSSLTSLGVGNFVVSTGEDVIAGGLPLLIIFLPLVAVLVFFLLFFIFLLLMIKFIKWMR